MAIEINNLDIAINNLLSLSKIKPIEVFNAINSESNEYLINLKAELKKNKKIIIYNNKKRLFEELNNIKLCPICLDTKLIINLDCGHPICIDCYPSINSCYLKCC